MSREQASDVSTILVRERLLDGLVAATSATIFGPSGSGKSTLALDWGRAIGVPVLHVTSSIGMNESSRLIAEMAAAAGHANMPDTERRLRSAATPDEVIGAVADRDDGVILVLDEVQLLADDAIAFAAMVLQRASSRCRVAVVGRRWPGPTAGPDPPPEVTITDRDLRCTIGEVEALLELRGETPTPSEVATIARITDGWTIAVSLVAAARARDQVVDINATRPEAIASDIVRSILDGLDAPLRDAVALVARLPAFSSAEVELVAGPRALDRLLDVGFPVTSRGDGWFEFADPVRTVVADANPLPQAQSRELASSLAARGAITAAVRHLTDSGDHDGVAALIDTIDWHELVRVGHAELIVTFESLPRPVIANHPGVAIAIGRVLEVAGRLDLRRRVLDAAIDASGSDPSTAAQRRLHSEWLESVAYGIDYADVRAPARQLLAATKPEELVTRGRLHWALARADARDGTPEQLRDAADGFELAATLFDRAGERELAASSLTALGYNVRFADGDIDGALRALTEARDLLHPTDGSRAQSATFLAEVETWAGRLDDAERHLREADEVARALGERRTRAFVAWDLALIASLRGDTELNAEYLRAAASHHGDWIDHPMGVVFLSAAAEMRARLGDEVGARDWLDRAIERADQLGLPDVPLLAVAAVEARFGEIDRTRDALERFGASPECVDRERWRLALFAAFVAHRAGDDETQQRHWRVVVARTTAMGLPGLPERFEPDLVAAVAGRTGTREEEPPRVTVTVLGGLTVRIDGRTVSVANGHPAQIIKLIALQSTPLHVEALLDRLWPELDLSTARERLRRTLYRVNRAGPLVERDGDTLRFPVGTIVDLHEFERLAASTSGFDAATGAESARQALSYYAGELLPNDRYEEWAAAPRERALRKFLALIDLIVADAVERGEIDEALRRLEAAIEAEPLDDTRLVLAADLLLAQGRTGSARAVVERACALDHDLGISPSPRLGALARRLGVVVAGG